MTKREIIDHVIDTTNLLLGDQVYMAMEIYAKQQVFEFLKFRNKYQREERSKMIELHAKLGGMTTWVGASDEKIYEEFERLNNEQPNNNP